jgi:hypothetical protein
VCLCVLANPARIHAIDVKLNLKKFFVALARWLTHGTLQRGLRLEQVDSGSQGGVKGLVAVEVADGDAPGRCKHRRVAADWK